MARLKNTWELKSEIESLKMSDELRIEIDKYIDSNCIQRGVWNFTNIMVRSNLHYIIDHINDDKLLNQLTKLNN